MPEHKRAEAEAELVETAQARPAGRRVRQRLRTRSSSPRGAPATSGT